MSEKFFDCLWKIENFAFCIEKQGQTLNSPRFTIDAFDKTKFYIAVSPRGNTIKDYIGVYIVKESYRDPGKISLLFDISFLNYESEALKSQRFEYDFPRHGGCGHGSDSFIRRDEVILEKRNKFLPGGTLTVLCRVRKVNGEEVREAGHCTARTHIGVEHRAFNWITEEILNLSAERYKTITIDSVKGKGNYPSVTMRLFFKSDLFSDGPLGLKIIQVDSARKNFLVCKISLMNEHGNSVLSVKDGHFFNESKGEQIWDFPLFVKKQDLIARKNSYLASGNLTLRCEYTMSVGSTIETIDSLVFGLPSSRMIHSTLDESCGTLPKSIHSSLKDDLQNFCKNEELCDVRLEIGGGESVPAHKVILSSRSPVFRAMFTNDLKENATATVCISDLEADTVKRMLSFMYTDAVDDLEVEIASKLYFAADKYQLESLKEVCSSYLSDHLEPSNVCDILVLADVYIDQRLKEKTEEFIYLNESEIIRSEEWKELMIHDSELAAKTLHQLCLKKT